jgi:shikimate kinase
MAHLPVKKIIITGFMGSGKSSVAKALAKLLDYEMLDLDEAIESAEGRSPAAIIQEDGEARFRALERQALTKAMEDDGKQVLALGGGAWISKANRDQIQEHGATSVWLDASFDLCWKRIAGAVSQRPLAPDATTAFKLFSERTSCYELADLRVGVTERTSAEEIAAEIARTLTKRTRGFEQPDSN